MMKKIILGSVVTAALVFTGCGSDDDTTPVADTQAPVVETAVNATLGQTIALATDNVAVTKITISGDDANMFPANNGSVTAPASPGTYHIKVVAEDAAGNKSAETDVTVTVEAGSDNTGGGTTPVANEVDLGNLGKWVKIQTADVMDDLNTADVNETSFARISHDDAVAFCSNLGTGWVLPSRDDILSIATSGNVADPANIVGQIVLNTEVLEAGTAATTSVIWTSNSDTSGVYLGSADGNGNADYNVTDGTTYFHTCVNK